MGTPGFAVASLSALHESHHEVVAAVTAPDRPAGRGRKLRSSDVKEYALGAGIPIMQPEKLKNEEFIYQLASYKADLFVVVAFRMLPEVVWAMPQLGTINLHGSLLPQYRGAAPINWALINGDKQTGVTTFFINAEIDKGEIIDQVEIDIDEDDTAGTLHDRLMHVGAKLVVKTADLIAQGQVIAQAQDLRLDELKGAPKLNHENRSINWSASAEQVKNLVRGLCPYPAAIGTLIMPEAGEIGCKIYAVGISEEATLNPGEVSTDNRSFIHVGTSSMDIEIVEIQLSGKKRMSTKALLNGFEIEENSRFIT
jgi:methionyl-tRNA formyltransferase